MKQIEIIIGFKSKDNNFLNTIDDNVTSIVWLKTTICRNYVIDLITLEKECEIQFQKKCSVDLVNCNLSKDKDLLTITIFDDDGSIYEELEIINDPKFWYEIVDYDEQDDLIVDKIIDVLDEV